MATLNGTSMGRKFVFLLSTCAICLVIQHEVIQRHSNITRTKRTSPAAEAQTIIKVTQRSNSIEETQSEIFLKWNQHERNSLGVFIFSAMVTTTSGSAMVTNSSGSAMVTSTFGSSHVVKINGWEAFKHRRHEIKCCYLWKKSKMSSFSFPNRTYWQPSTVLSATQYHCPIKRNAIPNLRGVTMEFNKKKCPEDETKYVNTITPMKQKVNSLAICGKIVYGDVDVKLLVEWLEYYRELKVDRIVLFTYNLSEKAMQVLQFYSKSGFVEVMRFEFPWKDSKNFQRDVGKKMSAAAFQDEQVVVYDCYERLHGYTYVAVIDLDEFVLPRKSGNLKDMMKVLTKTYPSAAGFTIKSFLFVKNWGKIVQNNGSDVVQYFNRTGAVLTRQKNIFLPSRVLDGTVWTHSFEPAEGYKHIIVPEKLAIMHHYRNCYPNLLKKCMAIRRTTDTSILTVVNRTQHRTQLLLQKFG